MDLKSGYPFWPIRNGLLTTVPPLLADARCDVAVVGGGITGALVAHELAAHGHDVIVLERRDVAWGSTAASTALLQYELDASMAALARDVGAANAARVYLACAAAIDRLADLAREVGDVGFRRPGSLYYASRAADVADLQAEFEARRALGLRVRWLDAAALGARYGLRAAAAILSAKAASMDPYRMASRMLARLVRGGTRVHDRSTVASISPRARGVDLALDSGITVRAGHAVIAAGYESQQWLDARVARNRSTYAFVTDPLPRDMLGALARTLVWETARPYLYMRTTDDGRLLVGGADDAVDVVTRRDRRVDAKARRLAKAAMRRFPHLVLEPAYAWAGTFAETADALPWFGAHPQWGRACCSPWPTAAMASPIRASAPSCCARASNACGIRCPTSSASSERAAADKNGDGAGPSPPIRRPTRWPAGSALTASARCRPRGSRRSSASRRRW